MLFFPAKQGHQTQISKEELTFRMTLFVAMMKAERVGTDDADVVVSQIVQKQKYLCICQLVVGIVCMLKPDTLVSIVQAERRRAA